VTRPIVLSDRALRDLARLKDAYDELLAAGEAEASIPEMARRAGVEEHQAARLIAADRAGRSLE
jgi:hypothetical protein